MSARVRRSGRRPSPAPSEPPVVAARGVGVTAPIGRSKRDANVRDHLFGTLESVFSRPRFGLSVRQELVKSGSTVKALEIATKFGDHFRLTCQSGRYTGWITVIRKLKDWPFNTHFYYFKFETAKMPNLRKIGVTIANKMNSSVIADVVEV